MYTDEQIQKNLTTMDRQLLFDIKQLLIKQNDLLESIVRRENEQRVQTPADDNITPEKSNKRPYTRRNKE